MKQRLIFIVTSTLIFAGICFQVHRIHCKGKSIYIHENLLRLSHRIDATMENLRRFSQYVHGTYSRGTPRQLATAHRHDPPSFFSKKSTNL